MKKKSRVLLFCPGSEMPIVVILVPIMIDFKYFTDCRIDDRKIEQYNNHSGLYKISTVLPGLEAPLAYRVRAESLESSKCISDIFLKTVSECMLA